MAAPNPPQVIGEIDENGQLRVAPGRINDRFDDGSVIQSISFQRLDDRTWQVLLQGTDADGNCQMVHTPVDFTAGGDIVLADEDFGGESTRLSGSCTGAPCSACRLLGGGSSCACADLSPSHSCNHTISTTLAIRNRFMKAFPDGN